MTKPIRKHCIIIVFLITIVSLLTSGIWTYSLYQQAIKANDIVITSYESIRAINRTLLAINDAALDVDALLLTKNKINIKKIREEIIAIQVNVETFSLLVHKQPIESQIFKATTPLIEQKIKFLQQVLKEYSSLDKKLDIHLMSDKSKFPLTDKINQLMLNIRIIKTDQLNTAMNQYQHFINIANQSFISLGLLNMILIFLSFFLKRQRT